MISFSKYSSCVIVGTPGYPAPNTLSWQTNEASLNIDPKGELYSLLDTRELYKILFYFILLLFY